MEMKQIKIIFIVLAILFILPILIFIAIKNPRFLLVAVVILAFLGIGLAEKKGWI